MRVFVEVFSESPVVRCSLQLREVLPSQLAIELLRVLQDALEGHLPDRVLAVAAWVAAEREYLGHARVLANVKSLREKPERVIQRYQDRRRGLPQWGFDPNSGGFRHDEPTVNKGFEHVEVLRVAYFHPAPSRPYPWIEPADRRVCCCQICSQPAHKRVTEQLDRIAPVEYGAHRALDMVFGEEPPAPPVKSPTSSPSPLVLRPSSRGGGSR